MHVMILEEDPVLRTDIASALAEVGCDVLALGRLDAAKEAARRVPVDVLLLGESVEGRLAHDLALLAEWRNPGLGAILLSDCEGERTDEIFELIPSLQAIVGRRTAPAMLASLALDAAKSRLAESESSSGTTTDDTGAVPSVHTVEAQAALTLEETGPVVGGAEMILPLPAVASLWELPPAADTILAQDPGLPAGADPTHPTSDMTTSAQAGPAVAPIPTGPMPRPLAAGPGQMPTRPSPPVFPDPPDAQASGPEAFVSAPAAGSVSLMAPSRPEGPDAGPTSLSAASDDPDMAAARPAVEHSVPSFLRRRPTGIEAATGDLPGGSADDQAPLPTPALWIAGHQGTSMVPDRPASNLLSWPDLTGTLPDNPAPLTGIADQRPPEGLIPGRSDTLPDLPACNSPARMATGPLASPGARPEPAIAPSTAVPAQGPARSTATTRDTLQLLRTLAARAAVVMEAHGRPRPTDTSASAAPEPTAPHLGAATSSASEPPVQPSPASASLPATGLATAPRDPRAELELRRAQLAAMGLHRGGRPAADPAMSPRLASSAASRPEASPAPLPTASATSGWRRLHLA